MKRLMKGKLMLLGTIVAISAITSAFAQELNYDNGRLFVKVVAGAQLPKLASIKNTKHLYGDLYVVSTQNARDLQDTLKNFPQVKATQLNYRSQSALMPEINTNKEDEIIYNGDFSSFNDPKANRVWSFLEAGRHGVSVNRAYSEPVSTAQAEVIVAVVDTGVDYNHEDLKDVMWTNPGEIAGNGIDDDQNGYVDDVYGINTLVRDSEGNATGNPMASHAHGTHVAGTIAATQNNHVGIAGIASHAKIMAIRTVPDDSDETDVDVVESFLYAAKHGAKLINCSFGKRVNEGGNIVQEAIEHIGQTYGTLVFAAAGNDYGEDIDKKLHFPASFTTDYMVVVASTSSRGGLSFFSNIGLVNVDVAAPGSSIYSTVPGNGYASMSGTSMATPTTVGVATEILSHNPNLSALQLKQVLMDTVTKVGSFAGKMVTGGRVDLYNGLVQARTVSGQRSDDPRQQIPTQQSSL